MSEKEKRENIRAKEKYLRERESLNQRIRYQKEAKKIGRVKRMGVFLRKMVSKSSKSTKKYLSKWLEPYVLVSVLSFLTLQGMNKSAKEISSAQRNNDAIIREVNKESIIKKVWKNHKYEIMTGIGSLAVPLVKRGYENRKLRHQLSESRAAVEMSNSKINKIEQEANEEIKGLKEEQKKEVSKLYDRLNRFNSILLENAEKEMKTRSSTIGLENDLGKKKMDQNFLKKQIKELEYLRNDQVLLTSKKEVELETLKTELKKKTREQEEISLELKNVVEENRN